MCSQWFNDFGVFFSDREAAVRVSETADLFLHVQQSQVGGWTLAEALDLYVNDLMHCAPT